MWFTHVNEKNNQKKSQKNNGRNYLYTKSNTLFDKLGACVVGDDRTIYDYYYSNKLYAFNTEIIVCICIVYW